MRSAAAASSVAFIDCTGLVSFGMDPVVSSFLPCCPAQAESDSATIATATPVASRRKEKEKLSCIVIEAPASSPAPELQTKAAQLSLQQ
ncbi:hypothetical protein EME01_26680 [Sinorhizobium meliloti]|nr:hypothetical protein EME01_26680 [Sinorhizobium meliloti]